MCRVLSQEKIDPSCVDKMKPACLSITGVVSEASPRQSRLRNHSLSLSASILLMTPDMSWLHVMRRNALCHLIMLMGWSCVRKRASSFARTDKHRKCFAFRKWGACRVTPDPADWKRFDCVFEFCQIQLVNNI